MSVPSTEPIQLRAGDTWSWRRELADYPAPTWTLKYRFKHPTLSGFEFTAGSDGTTHEVAVTATSSAGFYTGTTSASFGWVAWVESGAVRHTVGSGTITVLPNLMTGLAAGTADTRSHARKMLAAIEALLEGKAANDVQQYTIGNRSLTKMDPTELLKWRSYYLREVQAEDAAAMFGESLGGGYRVGVRL